jgi:phage shock protein C
MTYCKSMAANQYQLLKYCSYNHIMATKKLYRSEKDRMLGGVCGGLGEYFDIDPTIVRLLFVLVTLFGGASIFIYIILWIIIPSKSTVGESTEAVISDNTKEIKDKLEKMAKKDETRVWLGVAVICLGGLFLLNNFFPIGNFFFPIALICIGFFVMIRAMQ